MATQDERIAALERDVAELKQARRIQEDRDIALLARIDTFIDDLHRIERVQLHSFEEVIAAQKDAERRIDEMGYALTLVSTTLTDHKSAIETVAGHVNNVADRMDHLESGQQQIISILTGKPPLND